MLLFDCAVGELSQAVSNNRSKEDTMLDVNFVSSNRQLVEAALAARGLDPKAVADLLTAQETFRKAITTEEQSKALLKRTSTEFVHLLKTDHTAAAMKKEGIRVLSEQIAELE